MKLTLALSVLTASIALAAPVSENNGLVKRADPAVYLCNDRNFDKNGYCVHIVAPASVCVPLASDLDNKVSSVGPDKGSFCYFFVNPGCDTDGDFFHVGYPGYGDLSKTPVNGPAGSTRNYEDKLSSYFCVLD